MNFSQVREVIDEKMAEFTRNYLLTPETCHGSTHGESHWDVLLTKQPTRGCTHSSRKMHILHCTLHSDHLHLYRL